MKRILVMTLILAAVFAVVMAQPSVSEAWYGHSSFFVAAGPPFYGFPIGLGYAAFSRHSAFSIGFSFSKEVPPLV